jgi:hypothetical protein
MMTIRLKKKYSLLRKAWMNIHRRTVARFLNAQSMALDPHSNYLTREEH